jgi:DNA-binding CsgD family transcriptional regulator
MRLRLLEELGHEISQPTSEAAFCKAMTSVTKRMGFDYFATTYDEWVGDSDGTNFLANDYPENWGRFYTEFRLGDCDPVRRAGEVRFSGFAWRDMRQLIPMTRRDHQMLDIGRENGIADGYTVPRHTPALASASCTFAVGPNTRFPVEMLPIAEGVGGVALTTVQRIVGAAQPGSKTRLSDRQRDCVLLNARGFSAEQIAEMLGIKPGTVIHHLRIARERYGVHSSEALLVCALVDRLFSLADVYPAARRNYHRPAYMRPRES